MQISSSAVSASSSYNYTMNTGSVDQDEQIKSIQKQIENLQKQLQNLSENENMSPEVMMEKRKELQQQIQDLNKQISQRKMEIQREKREAAKVDNQETRPTNTTKEDYVTIGAGTMQGLISADASMKQINTVQSIKTGMEGRAGVLECEIKIDKSRGGSTEKKEAELAELNSRIDTTTNDMMDKISNINTGVEKPKEATDGQEAIENEQGKDVSEDSANAEVSETGHLDVQEQKNNHYDKPVIYTKTGTANQQKLEPEPKLYVLI
ncbi:FlxA-like family protein [Wukongibacter sp. M2B1]|uniref:FlxA-like family protein n=1 Tax=Wukongibacter sp. M2B1 TaxID=3088895 RepID=UPI003D78ED97